MASLRPGGRTARIAHAVMEATLDELAEEGLAGFSMERVAERAHVHKTTLYRRWGGRDPLVAAAISSGRPDTRPPPDTGSLRGDLVAMALEYLAFFDDERAAAITRVMDATTEPGIVAARRSLYEAREAAARSLYQRALERGELRDLTGVDTAIAMTFGAVRHHAFLMGRPLDRRFVEDVTDHALAGLQLA